jgi:hypothetical protein
MYASNNQHPLSPARRHFMGASAAFVAKVAAIAALASIAVPPSSQAKSGHGGGWGQGSGGGHGHCFLKGTRVLTSRSASRASPLTITRLTPTFISRLDMPFLSTAASWR